MALKENVDLIQTLENYLAERKCDEALRSVGKHEYQIFTKGLDLVPLVSRFCSKDTLNNDPELEACCEEILMTISQKGNAKELLIALLEQAEFCAGDDVKFHSLLGPIKTVLLRLPSKRGKSLEWVLNVLYSHIKKLPVPKSYMFENDERKMLDLDPDVQRAQLMLSSMVMFFKPFVKEVSYNENVPVLTTTVTQRELLTRVILLLFEHPLAYLDLFHEPEQSLSSSRRFANELVHYVRKLNANFIELFELIESKPLPISRSVGNDDEATKNESEKEEDDEESDNVSTLALGTFFYLVYAESVDDDHLPCIYTHKYILESCFSLVDALLKRTEECVVHKGILLSQALLKKISSKEFAHNDLDNPDHFRFAHSLINIMLLNDVKSFRQSCVQILQDYVNKFDYEGRYRILICLFNCNQHAGVQALLIQCFKNNLNETLNLKPIPSWFISKNLSSLLYTVVPLRDGVETDLLDQSDKIFASLNFVRFLAIRDDFRNNVTGFWDHVAFVQEKLVEPLQKALDMSKAHYRLELQHQQHESKRVGDAPHEIVSLGKQFPKMPREHCISVLHSALNTFDLMDSLVARTVELIEVGKVYVANASLKTF